MVTTSGNYGACPLEVRRVITEHDLLPAQRRLVMGLLAGSACFRSLDVDGVVKIPHKVCAGGRYFWDSTPWVPILCPGCVETAFFFDEKSQGVLGPRAVRTVELERRVIDLEGVLFFQAWVGYCGFCRRVYWADGS
jgi:hypothetical protein